MFNAETWERHLSASWSSRPLTLWHWNTRVVIYCLAQHCGMSDGIRVWVYVWLSVMIVVARRDEISGWWVIFLLFLLPFLHISPSLSHFPPFLFPHSSLHFPPSLVHSLSSDSREELVLGSIPLPSYVISPVGPEDHISRKYAFKVRLPLFYAPFLCRLILFHFSVVIVVYCFVITYFLTPCLAHFISWCSVKKQKLNPAEMKKSSTDIPADHVWSQWDLHNCQFAHPRLLIRPNKTLLT